MTDAKQHAIETGANQQFILFRVGEEGYALPLERVREIVRVTPMAPVPLAPQCLLGLANLRGRVLPVVSMRRAFAQPDAEANDANRILVFEENDTVTGLLVDRVSTIASVEASEVESAEPIQHSVDSDLLAGVVKAGRGREGEHMILDGSAALASAIGDARAALARRSVLSESSSDEGGALEDEAAQDETCLVSFDVDGQEYALEISAVREVVSMPERISKAPKSHQDLIGVATLRGELLPLVNLRSTFGTQNTTLPEGAKVVVARRGVGEDETRVGLVADHVREVLRAPTSDVSERPEALAATGAGSQIRSICHFDDGDRVVTVLDIEALCHIDASELKELKIEEQETIAMSDETDAAVELDEEQFVVFKLDDELYGVPIAAVQEIVRVPEKMTTVPQTPSFVDGVVNLRGGILPVINTRQWFGIDRVENAERQRIIVLQIGTVNVGFVVDAVSEVKRVPKTSIGPAPSNFGARSSAIQKIAQLQDNETVILLLDVEKLFSGGELNAIAA